MCENRRNTKRQETSRRQSKTFTYTLQSGGKRPAGQPLSHSSSKACIRHFPDTPHSMPLSASSSLAGAAGPSKYSRRLRSFSAVCRCPAPPIPVPAPGTAFRSSPVPGRQNSGSRPETAPRPHPAAPGSGRRDIQSLPPGGTACTQSRHPR